MDSLSRPFLLLFLAAATAFSADPAIDDPLTNPPNFPRVFPVGKTLIFPITATDTDGDPLAFKVTSNNPKVLVRAKTGEPSLKLAVTYGSPSQSGEMVFALFREWTPITSAFIGGFAQAGFYNGVKFHRVVNGFMLQGGDPLGTGSGGPGMTGGDAATAFKFENEFQPGLIFSGRGQFAMANAGYEGDFDATNGSQFFVTLGQPRFLDFKHTIAGQLLRGWTTVDAIATVPVHNNTGVPPEQSVPDTDVVITSATVEPNNHDAVLMISATGLATNAVITVTATDPTGGISTKSFTVSAVADTSNSPPVVYGVPPQTVPKDAQLNFGVRSFDLESDYLFLRHFRIGATAFNTLSSESGSVAAIKGNPGYEGPAKLGLYISQFDMLSGQEEGLAAQNFGLIGIGDRAITSSPVTVKGTPGAAFTGTVARFKDSDITGSAANFTAVVNWGDGTPEQAGIVAHDSTVPGSSTFAVSGTHTYARAGIYTIKVTATGNKGAVGIARTMAIINAGPIVAVGQQFDVKGPTAANRVLATFTDSGTPARPTDYTATVDWGDGVTTKGVVAKVATGFVVRGTHVYKDTEPFAISVRIHKAGTAPTADAYAWSTANVFGFAAPQHLPPFPMAHLLGAWNSGPTKQINAGITGTTIPDATKLKEVFTGAFIVLNSGTKTSPAAKLRYWLSDDTIVDGNDTPLLTNGLSVIDVSPFAAGLGGTGQFTIALPNAVTGVGKYLLGQLIYSDPIIDASRVDKVAAVPISGVYPFNFVSTVGQDGNGRLYTSEAGGTIKFHVLLDTQPAAGTSVTIALACLKPNENPEVVSPEATVSPASITFTPANWNTAVQVTVTGANDSTADGSQFFNLVIRKPTGTDARFTRGNPFVFTFGNTDND